MITAIKFICLVCKKEIDYDTYTITLKSKNKNNDVLEFGGFVCRECFYKLLYE